MAQRKRTVLAAIVAAATMLAALPQAQAKILAQWVELGADGTSSVRAITEDACPSVTFDGTAVPMSVRSEPGRSFGNVKPAQFPVRSCEVTVPARCDRGDARRQAAAAAAAQPATHRDFRRHRLPAQTGDPSQSCNDINAWPFPKIAAAWRRRPAPIS